MCEKLKPAVSGLEREFPGKVTARNVVATTPEASAEVKRFGIGSHGVVIQAEDGTVLWKAAHTVEIDVVRQAIKERLGA